jgi:sec-independent protein translocase protein TatC
MDPGSRSEGRPDDDTVDHGTADEIDAETDAHQEPSPEPVPDWDEDEAWDDEDMWDDEDFDESEDHMEQYKAQEELLEPPDQQLVEPEAEPEIEDAEPGGVLDRDRDGPPDDQEMPLTEHIEEMVKRLGIVVVMAAVVTILAWPFSEGATLHIWQAVLPTADAPDPHLYGPLEKVLTQIKVAGLAGVLIALPMVVYQTYRFMRPGLYPHERRYYLAAVPTSLVLAAAGMAFSYFIVLPTLFVYFMYYTEGSVDLVAFGLAKTFTLIVTLTGVLAVVFQIPLFIMLAIMMGVTSRRWLASKRIYFWAAFAGVSFLIAPDPTGMAPFLVAGTAIGLFEGTLFLLKWVKRGRRRYRRSREDGA